MVQDDELYYSDIAHKKDLLVSPSGDLDTVSGLENLRQALLRRLVTVPGSIIHRPNYGVGMQRYQNAPISTIIQQEVVYRIKEQFESDPRVISVLDIQFDAADETPETLKIIVKVDVVGLGEQEMNFIPFGGE